MQRGCSKNWNWPCAAICATGLGLLLCGCGRESAPEAGAKIHEPEELIGEGGPQRNAEEELARLKALAERLAGPANASLELFEILRTGGGAALLSCDLQEKMVRPGGQPCVLFCKVVDVARVPGGWRLDAIASNAAVELVLELDCAEAVARRVLEHREQLGDNAGNGFAVVAAFELVERPALGLRPVPDESRRAGAALRMTTDERVFLCRGRCLAAEHVGAAVQLLF